MTKIVIVYHTGYGHTAKVAEAVADGIRKTSAELKVIKADVITEDDWTTLDQADAIIFGAPTYMGGVSAPFKTFIDASSGR
jgi:NAD(P)H dehydrogenase (quinone)